MEAPCIRVNKSRAENIRRELLRSNLLDLDLRVRSERDDILLPIKDPMGKDLSEFGEFGTADFEPVQRPARTYKDVLKLPDGLQELLPSSFDLIGDVCIIKLPDELEEYSSEIGSAFLQTNRNVRVVTLDRGVKGFFRIRELEVIAGEDDLETVHVENNLRFKLDPSKVYFSPRLATERARVSAMINGGRVLDMFAGVGPFSINCARHGNPDEVIGIDLNPDCIEYFETNITLNSVQDNVSAFLGDAMDAPLGMGPFTIIIMNLPHESVDYLPTALQLMEIGRIHLYSIVDTTGVKPLIGRILEESSKNLRKIEISGLREVHNYSPTQSMMAIDINVLGPS